MRCRILVVHDGRTPIDHIRVDAVLTVAGRDETWSWGGSIEADSVTLIGTVEHRLGDATGEVVLDLQVTQPGPDGGAHSGEHSGQGSERTATNHYRGRIGAG